ncbi:hypothetical protein [Streptomyces goshikiensis]
MESSPCPTSTEINFRDSVYEYERAVPEPRFILNPTTALDSGV